MQRCGEKKGKKKGKKKKGDIRLFGFGFDTWS